jgi:hypothetical protein
MHLVGYLYEIKTMHGHLNIKYIRDFVTFSGATQQMKNKRTQPHFTRSAILSSGSHIKAVF